jgi:hypothetical protein
VVIVPGRSAESKLIQRLIGSDAACRCRRRASCRAKKSRCSKVDRRGRRHAGRAAEAAAAERQPSRAQNFFDAIAAHDLAAVRRMLAK